LTDFHFKKIFKYQICPVGAELLHVGGWMGRQADLTKLRVSFHNFLNEPKKGREKRSH